MHVHSQEGTNTILFQNPFKLMFNKYIKQCYALVSERYLNSYFYKKLKSYEMCNGSKSKVCFNIVVGSRNYGRIAPVL